MAKKITGFIAFGVSMLILLMYLMTTLMAPGSTWKEMLLLLVIVLPFMVLGVIGCALCGKMKVLSGIFMILAGIATAFLGLMCLSGGLPVLGILALPLGIIAGIVYLVAAVLTFVTK